MDPFALERYFAQYEFSAPYLLSPSDTEPRTLDEMINRADTECRSLWNSLTLGYTESRGLPALRDAIAAFVTASNGASAGSVTADDVLVFSCAEEAIYTVARVLVRPGDVVACIWPAYQSLYQVARAAGATIRPINARETSAAWDLNVEDIERSIPDGTRIVVANVPHNPTGMVPSPVSWNRLRQRTQTSGAILFADEVYRPLGAMRRPLPLSPVIEDNGRSLALGSVSKAFGLAGVRIGWVVCRDRALLRALEQYKDYTTICASAPAEVLALIALRCWRDLVDEQEAIIEANVSVYRQFAEDFTELVTSAHVGAGSTCFPSWVGPGTARAMAERAVTEAGVMVLPGDTFDPTGLGTGHLDLSQRFRVGLGRRSFAEVIGRFADHLTTAYLRER